MLSSFVDHFEITFIIVIRISITFKSCVLLIAHIDYCYLKLRYA